MKAILMSPQALYFYLIISNIKDAFCFINAVIFILLQNYYRQLIMMKRFNEMAHKQTDSTCPGLSGKQSI